jgi:hypothetical protein
MCPPPNSSPHNQLATPSRSNFACTGIAVAAARPQCEQCGSAESKYTCPGCQHRTCSLACVKQHKAASACSGKRDRLAFVPLKDFDDRNLLSGMVAAAPHMAAAPGQWGPTRSHVPWPPGHMGGGRVGRWGQLPPPPPPQISDA